MITNPHVEMLNAYQPFDADFAEIFFESSDLTLDVRTVASSALREAVVSPTARLVLLTGNAGHGKTHLCGQLLADIVEQPLATVSDQIKMGGYGETDICDLETGRKLRMIKDLSEVPVSVGGTLLSIALESDRVTVVCANEGRLRACIADAELTELQEAVNASITKGVTKSSDGSVTIIDLNHQSVVAGGGGITPQVINAWLREDEPWEPCISCPSATHCPILGNRTELAEDSPVGDSRRRAIELLLSVIERTGQIVTVRELLIMCAHMITGGLRCADVHDNASTDSADTWQWQFAYHETIFGDRLPTDAVRRIRIFSGLRRIDPKALAIRSVDDRLDPMSSDCTGQFPPPFQIGEGPAPSTRQDRQAELNLHQKMWRFMRRRSFFHADAEATEVGGPPQADQRLGLAHLDEFIRIVSNPDDSECSRIRNRILRGLEAVQGIYRGGVDNLAIVDPAFSSQALGGAARGPLPGGDSRDSVALVATEVSLSDIKLMSEYETWRLLLGEQEPGIRYSVDWIDRRVVLSLGQPGDADFRTIPLALHEFEYLLRSARGLRSREYFAPEIRRFVRALGAIAAQSDGGDEIILQSGSARRKLLIDGDHILEAG